VTGVVVFLGAGATKSCGGPLTSEILPGILRTKNAPTPIPDSALRLDVLEQFLRDLFYVDGASPNELYPGLPLLMSLLDTAIDRRQSFHPDWDLDKVLQLREVVDLGIFDLLEETLRLAPTNNHWTLLNAAFPGAEAPHVISTNYDLVIDTAMMAVSEARFPEARLPDYHCDIRTQFYANESSRFGVLLKLHGSLNWLNCRTCHWLGIGASESQRFIRRLQKIVGPSLEQSYAADGQPCPMCKTRLRPLFITPTHIKDYRNPHLRRVWCEAEYVLVKQSVLYSLVTVYRTMMLKLSIC
jgi:hypothetical protein